MSLGDEGKLCRRRTLLKEETEPLGTLEMILLCIHFESQTFCLRKAIVLLVGAQRPAYGPALRFQTLR